MFLFGGSKHVQSSQVQKYSGLQIQTSIYGKCIPIVYGRTRVAGNLLWYGDFNATAHSQGGSGKGGVGGGGGGKGGGGSVTYTYSTSFILALCEGPISNIRRIWWDKNLGNLSSIGFTFFSGSYSQSAWSYLSSVHPSEALNYRGISYVAAANLDLGNSAQLPQYNFEVDARLFGTAPNGIDANPSQVFSDFLTNSPYGAGFNASWIGDLTVWKNWCLANGLWVSPSIDAQTNASAFLDDLARLTNSAVVWNGGKLNVIPYGDANVTGNGYTYTAPSAPLFDLDDSNYLPSSGAGEDPVTANRKRNSDNFNTFNLEYLDRSNSYNTASEQAKDQASINTYGIRTAPVIQGHMFCEAAAARLSVQMILQRQAVRNVYTWSMDQRWLILDPMDIVTLTDARLGLSRQWVRIVSIEENSDNTLTFAAEEYLNGTGNAAVYDTEPLAGTQTDYNSDPGTTNVPVVFEAPLKLVQSPSLEVWMAFSGGENWGGCDVYVSTDGEAYTFDGRQVGRSRTGVLTGALAAYTEAANGPTIDQTNTLAVNLSESLGELISVSNSDALALNTLCYVDGELLSFADATLTASYNYDLTYLVRGAYGSTIGSHATGSAFARLDSQIYKLPVDQSRVGQAIFIKLLPYNIYGGGQPSIDTVAPLQYLVTGEPLLGPLPSPTALALNFTDRFAQLSWQGVTDIRSPIFYEIRLGSTFENAQIYSRTAQTRFPVGGTGTYWVTAFYLTPFGTTIYSETPVSIDVDIAALSENELGSYTENPSWSGTVSGGAQVDGTVVDLTLEPIDILAQPDVFALPDIYAYGGVAASSGYYTIPAGHRIFSEYVANAKVTMNWFIAGSSINDTFLGQSDFLTNPDFLGSQYNASVYAIPQVRTSQDGGSTWGDWQNWVPGTYPGNGWDFRIFIATLDNTINAVLSVFSYSVDLPNLPLSGQDLTSNSADVTVSYGQTFNTVPVPQVTVSGGSDGDIVVINNETDSGFDVSVYNGGSRVVRTINWGIASW